jgi:hypothetical protein
VRLLRRLKSFLAGNRLNLCLAVAGALIGLTLAEVFYRVYLHRRIDTSEYDHLSFSVQDKSYSEYDALLGFHYKPGLSVDWCSIEESLPNLTGTLAIDRRGNSGPEVDDAGSEVRIAVVGDSFTVLQHDGITWPYLLQQLLRERTGRKVAVYNHARDGYGVLQMIDLASTLVDERPDLILIAFITPDLTRARFWRMEVPTPRGVEGFTSATPALQLDKPETYTRTAIVNPLATREWAERTRASRDRNDPVLRSLLDTYLREKHNYSITRFDPLSLRSSYVWERLTHPRVRAAGGVNSEVTFTDFAADGRFREEVAKLKRSGIPVYLIILPWFPDLAFGQYVNPGPVLRLLNSLKKATGFPVIELLPPAPMGFEAKTMILSPNNPHPSMTGLKYYSQKVAQALANDPVIGGGRVPSGAGDRPAGPE